MVESSSALSVCMLLVTLVTGEPCILRISTNASAHAGAEVLFNTFANVSRDKALS